MRVGDDRTKTWRDAAGRGPIAAAGPRSVRAIGTAFAIQFAASRPLGAPMRAWALAIVLVLGVGACLDALRGRPAHADGARTAQASWAASHFRVDNPAHLDDEAAEALYRKLVDRMAGLYELSREPNVEGYTRWPRYVRSPYLAAAHGNRYHTIYARSPEGRYGRYERAGEMLPGTAIVKDSFSVSEDGQVHPGPLSLMEKLEPGSSPETGDWRFVEIMPDGSLFGSSTGPSRENVAHCATCHRAVAQTHDWLYFPPPDYRVDPAP